MKQLRAASTGQGKLPPRKLWVSPQADRLMLAVTRPHDAAPSKIEVQVDGRPAGQFDVPRLRWGSGPQPVEISLADYHQRQVTVQIRQRSEGDHVFSLQERKDGSYQMFAEIPSGRRIWIIWRYDREDDEIPDALADLGEVPIFVITAH